MQLHSYVHLIFSIFTPITVQHYKDKKLAYVWKHYMSKMQEIYQFLHK